MTDRLAGKKIAPAAIHALKEALALVYSYKSDLRSFLTQSMADPTILSRLNWDDYKRNIVARLIDFLSANEDVYQRRQEAHERRVKTGAVQQDGQSLRGSSLSARR